MRHLPLAPWLPPAPATSSGHDGAILIWDQDDFRRSLDFNGGNWHAARVLARLGAP